MDDMLLNDMNFNLCGLLLLLELTYSLKEAQDGWSSHISIPFAPKEGATLSCMEVVNMEESRSQRRIFVDFVFIVDIEASLHYVDGWSCVSLILN